MDVTSYLLGKNASGGGGGKQEFTITAGTSTSASGYHKVIEQIDELTLVGNSMEYLFRAYSGTKIPKINSNAKIKNLNNAFANCTELRQLDLSNLDLSEVENIQSMFWLTSKLAVIDISTLETSYISSYSSAFSNCGTSATVSDGAYASGIPYVYVKNATVQSWVIGKVSNWSTANVVIKSN